MLDFIDKHIKLLIWSSIILLFVELGFNKENSLDSALIYFLWIERLIACVFSIEYYIRFKKGGFKYTTSPLGMIDLVSFLPFWIGFILPIQLLGWVRCLRILRTLKLFRYDRHLQLFALAVWRSYWLLKAISKIILITTLFGTALIYQAERCYQDDFNNIFNVMYFVITTITTIGYGDMSPVTVLGKVLDVLFVYLPGIAIFAAMVGIVGNAWSITMDEEKDPDYDPIETYKKERERKCNLKNLS